MSDSVEIRFEEEHFYNAVETLSSTIKQDYNPDFVIGIARGGVPLGRELADSDQLDAAYREIALRSYDGQEQQKQVSLLDQYLDDLHGDILLVDDIVDSGNTMEQAIAYLQEQENIETDSIKTAAIHHKPEHSSFEPDYFYQAVRDQQEHAIQNSEGSDLLDQETKDRLTDEAIWIIYPWEDDENETIRRRTWLGDIHPPATDVDILGD